MKYIGCHLSVSAGLPGAAAQAASIGGNTFQFFTRNPRGSKARKWAPGEIEKARAVMAGFGPLVLHGSYTMNLCTADEEGRTFAAGLLREDLEKTAQIPGALYNFHPGSHVGQGTGVGIGQIAAALNGALIPEYPGFVLLETMAGKGSEIGGRFEELREILDRVTLREKLGVCMDLCHVWDGGYDIAGDLDGVLTEFDRVIGLERLKAVHINDSKNPLGSHCDRHARIGEGFIGGDALRRAAEHPALEGLPMILETPNDLPGYASEIAFLRC